MKVRKIFKDIPMAKTYYRFMQKKLIESLYNVSPVLLAKLRFLVARCKMLNLRDPVTFDEKLLWLMLYWRHPLKTQCADKYGMRSYVRKHGLGHVLPKLLGVYQSASEIDFSELPDRFVLKCTHGCKFNIFCNNKNNFDMELAIKKLNEWMNIDYSKVQGELHYEAIRPHIICEPFLDDLSGDLPNDYKIYCFDGKVHCTMVCSKRSVGGHAIYDFFDRDWKNRLPYSKHSVKSGKMIPKPAAYEEMIEVSERLSKPFPFVRMDFYSIDGKALLGEMTFTPAGCIDKGYTDIAQYTMGKLIRLPEKLF